MFLCEKRCTRERQNEQHVSTENEKKKENKVKKCFLRTKLTDELGRSPGYESLAAFEMPYKQPVFVKVKLLQEQETESVCLHIQLSTKERTKMLRIGVKNGRVVHDVK
tara:strand:+ start:1181 stop:1504 length:324 start_codon:yes stop_codon:yes gene_type:complete